MALNSRSTLAALVPPALLAALLPGGCARQPTPSERLALEFPAYAAKALGGASSRFVASPRGFVSAGEAAPIAIELPRDAAAPIRMRTPGRLAFEMQEVGASGTATLGEHALIYPRRGVTSFWSLADGAAEEWIHVDAGVARRGAPLLAWEIAGATPLQRGAAVEVIGRSSLEKVRVTAPAAYAAGRAVEVSLRVVGQRIELYVDAEGEALLVDPKWVAAAPMMGARYYHAAARLQSGDVLVCGGSQGVIGGEVATAEIYDPTADQWTSVGDMASIRANHTATTLTDGTVLVVAGSVSSGASVIGGVEIYDPSAGWSTKPSIPNARSNHTATRLASGSVLVAGGFGGSGSPVSMSDVEIYDPNMAGGSWSFTDAMFDARARHTATELQDHRVLVAGGNNFGAPSATAEIYDETTGHWTQTATDMNVARENHGARCSATGRCSSSAATTRRSRRRVPSPARRSTIRSPTPGRRSRRSRRRGRRTRRRSSPTARFWSRAARTRSPRSRPPRLTIPTTRTWSAAPDMITVRSDHTATRLTNGRILVAGGSNGGSDIAAAELYDAGAACTMDPDCPPDQWCNVDACAPKKAQGAPAQNDDECKSGFAHDGVCCDKACDGGPCEACAMTAGATKDGQCTEVTAKCDDMNACTDDACVSGVCVSQSRLDGTPCEGGVCIAGVCLLDTNSTTSTGSGTASNGSGEASSATSSGTGAGGGGGSGGGVQTATGELVGGGCSASSTAPPRSLFFAGGLLAFLFGWRRRNERS